MRVSEEFVAEMAAQEYGNINTNGFTPTEVRLSKDLLDARATLAQRDERIKDLEGQLDEAKTISVQMASAFGVSCELLKALVEGVEAVGGKIDAKDMAQVNTILQLAEYLLSDGKEAAALRGEAPHA